MVDVNTVSILFAGGSVILLMATIVLVVLVLGFPDLEITKTIRNLLDEQGLRFAALVAVMATFGSLYYSEFAGFTPCKFCHYQRHAMYPLAVLLPLGVLRADDGVRIYGMVIAGIGFALASYHVRMQFWPSSVKASCSLDAPCTQRLVTVFGDVVKWPGTEDLYGNAVVGVSIPMMAWSFFLAIIVILGLIRTNAQANDSEE